MKFHFTIFSYLFTFLFYCTSQKYIPPYFSHDGYKFEQFPALYDTVPYFEGNDIYIFIVELTQPQISEEDKKIGIVGTVLCHALIDEYGNIEAIYIKKPLHPVADNASINAILKSEFKTLKEVSGKKGKYSLIIPFEFYQVYQRDLDYFFDQNKDKTPKEK
jgi:hypothetical protein